MFCDHSPSCMPLVFFKLLVLCCILSGCLSCYLFKCGVQDFLKAQEADFKNPLSCKNSAPHSFKARCYGGSSSPCMVPDVIIFFLSFITLPASSCSGIAMIPLGINLYFFPLMWPLVYLCCAVCSASFQVFFFFLFFWNT